MPVTGTHRYYMKNEHATKVDLQTHLGVVKSCREQDRLSEVP